MKIIKKFEAFLGSENKINLPEPVQTDLYTYEFKVPVKVSLDFDESIFYNYSNINDIAREIENKYDIDTLWLPNQFESWKEDKINEIGEEPELDDYEYEEWKEQYDKYENEEDSELLYNFADDEFGNWDNFLKEFEIDSRINDIIDARVQKEIFDNLKEDFNEDDLTKYFDDADKLGISSMQVIGHNFDDEGKFHIEVKTTKKLNDNELDEIKDYIEGQCSDGWGEGFEQTPIENLYVSPWWADDNKFGEYKIDIVKL